MLDQALFGQERLAALLGRRRQPGVALQQPCARIPPQQRVVVAGRPNGFGASRTTSWLPAAIRRRPRAAAGRAVPELGLGPPLADDARVVGALVVAVHPLDALVCLGDSSGDSCELVGQRQQQRRERLLVLRLDLQRRRGRCSRPRRARSAGGNARPSRARSATASGERVFSSNVHGDLHVRVMSGTSRNSFATGS